jgi:hypothetical protein
MRNNRKPDGRLRGDKRSIEEINAAARKAATSKPRRAPAPEKGSVSAEPVKVDGLVCISAEMSFEPAGLDVLRVIRDDCGDVPRTEAHIRLSMETAGNLVRALVAAMRAALTPEDIRPELPPEAGARVIARTDTDNRAEVESEEKPRVTYAG